MHFLKGGFLSSPKFYPPKAISRRNLEFAPLGFGYKMTPIHKFSSKFEI